MKLSCEEIINLMKEDQQKLHWLTEIFLIGVEVSCIIAIVGLFKNSFLMFFLWIGMAAVEYLIGFLIQKQITNTRFYDEIKKDSAEKSWEYKLGVALQKSKHYEEAEEQYREVIKIYPNSAQTHLNLGVLLDAMDRHEEAVTECGEAIRINPDLNGAHFVLGSILCDLKEYKRAEQEARQEIQINPSPIGAHHLLGFLLGLLGNDKEAEEEYRKELQINSNFAETHYRLGAILGSHARFKEAKIEILRAKELFRQEGDMDRISKCDEMLKMFQLLGIK